MYFTQNPSLHEIEKLMRMIPNFRPRGHGIIVLCGEEDGTVSLSSKLWRNKTSAFSKADRQQGTAFCQTPIRK